MDGPTPLVEELLALAAAAGLKAHARFVVPGCGYGHDAARLQALGFDVTAVDFSPRALEGARGRYGEAVRWVEADWFQAGLPGHDALLDHTCFPSFAPSLRPALVAAHAAALAAGGLWLGAFFSSVPKGTNPPYAVGAEELVLLAEERFEVLNLLPATRSHPARAGRELLLVARRRPEKA
jgi:methyl halide transferase